MQTVGQVPALVELHAHDRVAVVQQAEHDRGIGRAAGVALHVDVLGAEEFLRPPAGQVLDLVDVLLPAVVPLARVSFGVLVGQDGPHGFQDGRRDVVLRRDEFDPVPLAFALGHQQAVQFFVSLLYRGKVLHVHSPSRAYKKTPRLSGSY